jgi:hypothetical protein
MTNQLRKSDGLLHRSREDIHENSLSFLSGIDSRLRAASCATVELDVTEQIALAFSSVCAEMYSFMDFNKKCGVEKIFQLIRKFSYKRLIERQRKPNLLRRLDN